MSIPSKSKYQEIDDQVTDFLTSLLDEGSGASEFQKNLKRLVTDLFESGYNMEDVDTRQILRDAGYIGYVEKVVDGHSRLLQDAEDAWGLKTNNDALARVEAVQAVDVKRFGDLGIQFSDELQQALQEAALGGGSYKETFERLVGVGGDYTRHMETLRLTSLTSYSSALNMEKALEAGLTKFKYAGQLTGSNRSFCERLLREDKSYSREHINAMDNGNLNPVWIYRGGYNCIHRWVVWDEGW